MDEVGRCVADAVLAIDTLWGGDVMCPSGTGRFIADSWFSDESLPRAYTLGSADAVRKSGGLSAKQVDGNVVERYLREVDVPGAIGGISDQARAIGGLRGAYLDSLAKSLDVMYRLAMEVLGKGPAVQYAECVVASTGKPPQQSDPRRKRDHVAALLSTKADKLLNAADEWRRERNAPMASVKALGAAVIAHFDELAVRNLVSYLPLELAWVPRANISFLPIQDAWFSGSMNYVGRARTEAGKPKYEATYEINASLQISFPEFQQLVSHEVVPGHVTTFAYLQDLYARGKLGFEATVLTMNTRFATLCEGIANNAILVAHGVTEIEQLPDEDLQIGVLLALLQDDAKNQSSYLTWAEKREKEDVAKALRREFLVSEERADKLSGAWGRHPLLGRMYLPAYRAGTEKVAQLRREHPPERILPVLYACEGLVDVATIDRVLIRHPSQDAPY